jgi:hypothetical protein
MVWQDVGARGSHGPATVVRWSISAFLLEKATVGPRSSGEVGGSPLPKPGAASDNVNELNGHHTSPIGQ